MIDLSKVKANKFDVLPEGKYNCSVAEAKMADTKSGGMMIKVKFNIIDGFHSGRNIFTSFNVENSNPKAVEIGLGQLKSLMECAGHPTPDKLKGVDELVGLKVGVKTRIRKDDGYGDQAEVSYFFKPAEIAAPATEDKILF